MHLIFFFLLQQVQINSFFLCSIRFYRGARLSCRSFTSWDVNSSLLLSHSSKRLHLSSLLTLFFSLLDRRDWIIGVGVIISSPSPSEGGKVCWPESAGLFQPVMPNINWWKRSVPHSPKKMICETRLRTMSNLLPFFLLFFFYNCLHTGDGLQLFP